MKMEFSNSKISEAFFIYGLLRGEAGVFNGPFFDTTGDKQSADLERL